MLPPVMDECISVQELADRLGLSVFTLRRMIRSGEIRTAPGRPDAVRRADLQEFLRERELPAWPAVTAGRPDSP
jgi:excisionase family DNA binding protein